MVRRRAQPPTGSDRRAYVANEGAFTASSVRQILAKSAQVAPFHTSFAMVR